jgi:hypothetical protein
MFLVDNAFAGGEGQFAGTDVGPAIGCGGVRNRVGDEDAAGALVCGWGVQNSGANGFGNPAVLDVDIK